MTTRLAPKQTARAPKKGTRLTVTAILDRIPKIGEELEIPPRPISGIATVRLRVLGLTFAPRGDGLHDVEIHGMRLDNGEAAGPDREGG